jgi:hypothetical protein
VISEVFARFGEVPPRRRTPFTCVRDNSVVVSSILAASMTSVVLLGFIRWWEER